MGKSIKVLLLTITCLLGVKARIWTTDLVNSDHIYVDYVKTVTFHQTGLPLTLPIVMGQGSLTFAFDDINGGSTRYKYYIEHCDRFWQASNLSPNDYLDGFDEDNLRQVDFSVGTYQDYSHYTLVLPNNVTRWTKSGNYLLHIFDEASGEPVITRRFGVADIKLSPTLYFRRPVNTLIDQTHQSFEVAIDIKDFNLSNPLQDVSIQVIQNCRWQFITSPKPPNFIRGTEVVFLDNGQLTLPGGKEFRTLDIRSLRARTVNVEAIEVQPDGVVVFVEPEPLRATRNYIYIIDGNGAFVIENKDRPGDPQLTCDYAHVNFLLQSSKELDQDIYLLGGFNHWECLEEDRLRYKPEDGGYVIEKLLKQGYYNYAFAMKDEKTGQPNYSKTEGDSYETENNYTVLIYYHPIGARYDQLIGLRTFNSLKP